MGAKVSFKNFIYSSSINYSYYALVLKEHIISNGNLSFVKTDISSIGLK